MNTHIDPLLEIKLVGIKVRTLNSAEMCLDTTQIGKTIERFFKQGMQEKIKNRRNTGTVFAVYTEYESDEHGAYTYFLGEEVTSFESISKELNTLTIPKQTYVKLTSRPGVVPDIVLEVWQTIWKMNAEEIGRKRAYIADFEIYDERSRHPNHGVVDVFIGIKK